MVESRQGGRIRNGTGTRVVEVWEGVGRARPRSNRLLQQLGAPGLDLAPGDASEVSGGEVPNATMAMLRSEGRQRRVRELIGRTTCQQWKPGGQSRRKPTSMVEMLSQKRETTPTEMQSSNRGIAKGGQQWREGNGNWWWAVGTASKVTDTAK